VQFSEQQSLFCVHAAAPVLQQRPFVHGRPLQQSAAVMHPPPVCDAPGVHEQTPASAVLLQHVMGSEEFG
jgi:hypothetical protein